MPDKDVTINNECCVRRNSDDTYESTLNLRIGSLGSHREATNLSVGEAKLLREELDAFINEPRPLFLFEKYKVPWRVWILLTPEQRDKITKDERFETVEDAEKTNG